MDVPTILCLTVISLHSLPVMMAQAALQTDTVGVSSHQQPSHGVSKTKNS
ncbi:Uncharacterised protein [Segatella copri]|nr:Uncharacterised protein [Segatella copri]